MCHIKSPVALSMAAAAQDTKAFNESIKGAFELHAKQNSHPSWEQYEAAAALMGKNRITHLLLDTLAFKAPVLSDASEPVSPRLYSGPAVPAALRERSDLEPVQSRAALEKALSGQELGMSYRAVLLPQQYREACAPVAKQLEGIKALLPAELL